MGEGVSSSKEDTFGYKQEKYITYRGKDSAVKTSATSSAPVAQGSFSKPFPSIILLVSLQLKYITQYAFM